MAIYLMTHKGIMKQFLQSLIQILPFLFVLRLFQSHIHVTLVEPNSNAMWQIIYVWIHKKKEKKNVRIFFSSWNDVRTNNNCYISNNVHIITYFFFLLRIFVSWFNGSGYSSSLYYPMNWSNILHYLSLKFVLNFEMFTKETFFLRKVRCCSG